MSFVLAANVGPRAQQGNIYFDISRPLVGSQPSLLSTFPRFWLSLWLVQTFCFSLITRMFLYIPICFLAHDGIFAVKNDKLWNAKIGKFLHAPNSG